MRTSNAPHWDVAAYALGVLDAREAALFEDHLAECGSCAAELESFLPVTAMLAEVDRESFLGAEESQRDGRMLEEMVNVVAFDRSRAQARRLLAVAAGTVVMVLAVGLALFAGSRWNQSAQVAEPPPATATSSTAPGIGGQEGPPPDEIFDATDRTTGVNAKLGLSAADWGTAISIELSNVRGPLACQLVAVGPDVSEVVSTWTVPPDGYGTAKHPDPVFLQASTSVPRKRIERFEVQSVSTAGVPTVLVSVNV
ncbi:MAG: zf-HC2 domain-containing protein [Micromonosporaceae bacterium]|nr:zf-HC2 domain-containing protein [Micromonosporaceae bacterium]